MIFDTHIHLNDCKLYGNIEKYISDAKKEGIIRFLCVGWDIDSSKLAIEISTKYKEVYAAIAIMPTEFRKFTDTSIDDLRELAKNKKVVAIGEIGLDYYWEKTEEVKVKQKEIFIKQIELANELNLPITIHCRDAFQDCLDIVKKFHVKRKSVMHCYAGSLEMAKEFIKANFVIAFGGTLTYKNSINVQKVYDNIDLKDIVFETDAPYLAPASHRGQINVPQYIKDTIIYASNRRKIGLEAFEKQVFENSLNIFHVETND